MTSKKKKKKEIDNLSIVIIFGDLFGPVRPDELTTDDDDKRAGTRILQTNFRKIHLKQIRVFVYRSPYL